MAEIAGARVGTGTAWTAGAVRLAGLSLTAVSWFSAAVFGAYILAFYLRAVPLHRLERWNTHLPGLYAPGHAGVTAAMGAHMAAGAVLLVLGPLQLVGAIRRRWPAVHRWIGRTYVSAAGLAGVGGLLFMAVRGTVGGPVMDLGFGVYGVLITLAALQTYRHAAARRLDLHRAWAVRLFALAIGSWLYRMEYGLWLGLIGHLGHTKTFHGPFDAMMAFFFYVPNLVLAEIWLRARPGSVPSSARALAALVLFAATGLIGVGTWYFTRFYWAPAIMDALLGRAG